MPRKRKKRKSRSKKKATDDQISIDTKILEKLVEGIEFDDLLKLVYSWGYKTQKKEEITKNIDLLKTLNINTLSKRKFADLWALRSLKNKIWKKFKAVDPLPSRLGKITLKKRCKTALKSEGLEKRYTPHVFSLDNNRQLHIVLEFIDEPFLVETESAFSYQLIKPITRLSSILDRDEKTIYIEAGDGKNSVNAENFRIFENILQKALKTSFERVRVRPYELKEIADKSSKSLKKVVFVCPREISGIEGVDRITVEGDDVVAGLKDIASRHEVNIEKVGAWAEILSMKDDFLLSLDGRIKNPSLLNKE